ncbi:MULTISPECIES: superoxide dismutase [Candidatus Ichthyocystis]|uniref:Superoxide dismutase n=1 Tax=Candidatus Ichthyocystis hellenicum TaxID=1561003 RepID=A0A0S4M7D9_9BURK|nr:MULTISPECIES: superoxide dismutase [Ichthyocystis]CUT18198.1 Superoxide dismutase [Candidatus Ichthyocystis hellenicum]
MKHELPPLPYAYDELEPFISKETLITHHDKHHAGYVNNLNKLIVGTEFEDSTLEDIICKSNGVIFNNAAQVWNHNFYFECLRKPLEDNSPSGDLATAIEKRWSSFDNFRKEFTAFSAALFGSAWAWLVLTPDNTLEMLGTSNASTPLSTDSKALLSCDVWEHAYYIDHKNVRAEYLESFWSIVNWDFVAKNFAAN